MNKTTVKAVEALVFHVIENRLIPRVKKELQAVQGKSELSHYRDLLAYFESFSSAEAKATAEKALSIVTKAFMGFSQSDLEDLIGNVISSTIQGHETEFGKVKKSTFGFWENGYDLKQSSSNFPKAFCHVLYKAVQSQTRNIETLRKHQIVCSDVSASSDDDFNFLDTVPDTRKIHATFENMVNFEKAVTTLYSSVLRDERLDDIDRRMFRIWFDLKNEVDFSSPVRMSSAVYPRLAKELKEEGKSLCHGAMHYRWNRIRTVISDNLL